jgi:hypothetical protein
MAKEADRLGHKKPVKWYVLVILFCVPVAYFLSSSIRRTREADQLAKKPHLERQKKSIESWGTLDFHPLSASQEELLAYLKAIPLRGGQLLDGKQHDALFSSILIMFDAFQTGSFESYLKFRLPEGADYTTNTAQFAVIRDNWKQARGGAVKIPVNDHELFKWWVGQQSGGDFYKGFWQSVCLHPEEIYTKLGVTNEIGVSAKAGIYISEEIQLDGFGSDAVYSTFHAGLTEYPPSFRFTAAVSQAGTKLCASLYFFIRPSVPDPVIPVGVRFMWDRKALIWVPIDLVQGNLNTKPERSFVF